MWTKGSAFYLDGVGFTPKYNQHEQALVPRPMSWRKPAGSLCFQQTAKGSHEGRGGRIANRFAAIVYQKSVILADQYEGQLNASLCKRFVVNLGSI